jgi:predicted TIM-barrel fold metal-dependent hydrolase
MGASPTDTGRYVVVSSDCHAGADLLAYKPYLESRYHARFDEWAAAFDNPFTDLVTTDAVRNWDSAMRLRDLEDEGVVAEVVFPNTVPPFFPSGSLIATAPTADEFELRWAGLRAHNRWLADFCADAPGRRAGVGQILLNDVEAAVGEIRWMKEAGLTGGILLPGVPPDSALEPLFSPTYEPIWATCAELGVPMNSHAGGAAPAYGWYKSAAAMFIMEVAWFSHRSLWHLIFSGVFERHPDLRYVLTEQGSGWVPETLATLDNWYERFSSGEHTSEVLFGSAAVEDMTMRPSEYWARNCAVGASMLRPDECAMRDTIGVERIMWGADYPHLEGTHPYTAEALRNTFAGVPTEEVAAMLGGNAAAIYGFDLDALATVAGRVGPLVDDVATPLDELPAGAPSSAFR